MTKIKTDVFSLRDGEWQIRIGDAVPPHTWSSKGAALAGVAAELLRLERKETHEAKNVT